MTEQGRIEQPKHRRLFLTWWIQALALVAAAVIAVVVLVVINQAVPILRNRVIETLSARFHGPVQLADFHVSITKMGIQVRGAGLKIFGPGDPNPSAPGVQPLIAVGEFRFGADILHLLHTPMRVRSVYLQGLQLNIPPKEERHGGLRRGKIKIYVDEFDCDQTRLIINTLRPGKLPIEFDIGHLQMRNIGPGQPLQFNATLVNPKPVGNIQSTGLFGPWDADDPRSSPVKGNYSFTQADLSTIHGIAGILSSTGEYVGTLGNIMVDGSTETPDFRISVSGHPVPLHTDFHAIVDGTSGDTYLEPLRGRILHSSLIAKGSISRVKSPNGHRVVLDVDVEPARIEDLLKLGVRTDPPVMTGAAILKTKFDLSPGEPQVANRIRLSGTFEISGAHFTNEKVQSKVDELSLRSRGRLREAKDGPGDGVLSEMKGTFKLSDGLLFFPKLHYEVPGTNVDLRGKYSLDGNQFDLHGKARMETKLSDLVGGWKSLVLKPADPFFSKHGAGTELPIKVTGTKSAPHLGLDFGHKDESH